MLNPAERKYIYVCQIWIHCFPECSKDLFLLISVGDTVLALTIKTRKSYDFQGASFGSHAQSINFVFFQNSHLNIVSSLQLWVKYHFIPTSTHYLSNLCIEIYDNIGSQWLPGIKFWKLKTNYWESLTPRLPLMQALVIVIFTGLIFFLVPWSFLSFATGAAPPIESTGLSWFS